MEKGKFYFSVKDFLENKKNNTKNIFILVAQYTSFNLEDLKYYDGGIFGGIVPFVVYNNKYYDKGIIVYSLDENSDFLIVEDLNHLNVSHTFFETRIMKMVENIFFNKFKNKGKDKKNTTQIIKDETSDTFKKTNSFTQELRKKAEKIQQNEMTNKSMEELKEIVKSNCNTASILAANLELYERD